MRLAGAPRLLDVRSEPVGRQLPSLSDSTLLAAMRRLSARELATALTSRYLPISFAPGPCAYAAADEAAMSAARAETRPVVARIDPRQLVASLQTVYGAEICRRAIRHLAAIMPHFSAARRMTGGQTVAIAAMIGASAGLLYAAPGLAAAGFSLVFGVIFLAVCGLRLLPLLPSLHRPLKAPPRLTDEDLPVYTVLVPLFRETEVLDQLIEALETLDYPASKLDIKLVLEDCDWHTRRHLARLKLPRQFEVLLVPEARPQTKPKALNYALHFARGDLVTIYDAEDIPGRRQLRLAAETFAQSPHDLVCLQARLCFYNAGENWLTRQFAIEYAALYDLLLPALSELGLPLPLGGTSNHFRIGALRRLGAWDPYNVTEDADLGIRLARFGWRAAVIRSATAEEAACRYVVWLRQRARWLKGWMQVSLVHLRSPARLWRELGPLGFLTVQVLLVGMVVSALAHPLFVGLLLWAILDGRYLVPSPDPMTAVLGGLSLAILTAGYGLNVLAGWLAIRRRFREPMRRRLIWSLAGIPVYWILISIGGWLALWQLATSPFHWNKTAHGLTRLRADRRRARSPN